MKKGVMLLKVMLDMRHEMLHHTETYNACMCEWTGEPLAQVMACCLRGANHYLDHSVKWNLGNTHSDLKTKWMN